MHYVLFNRLILDALCCRSCGVAQPSTPEASAVDRLSDFAEGFLEALSPGQRTQTSTLQYLDSGVTVSQIG